MHPQPSKQFAESLSGLIERVTFFNDDTGFAVLKVKAKGHRDFVTVLGSVPSVSAGEWVTAEGRWIQDKEFGLQLRAEMLSSTAPTTREGIEKYLGSGMVKGIGPVYAKKLVEKFGERIFEIIEKEASRLEELDGIGPKRRKLIKDAWAEQKVIRQIMVFLHSNGVSTSRAVRIYKTYGEDAIEKVQANPYALAKDIHGIGFKTADQIAQKIGIPVDSLLRAGAGLNHVLIEATGDGHCALPVELLKDEAGKLLLVDDKIVTEALARTLASRDLVQETISGQELIFLPHLKRAEKIIAGRIKHLSASPSAFPAIDFEKAVVWCQQKTGKELAPSQREALKLALSSRALESVGRYEFVERGFGKLLAKWKGKETVVANNLVFILEELRKRLEAERDRLAETECNEMLEKDELRFIVVLGHLGMHRLPEKLQVSKSAVKATRLDGSQSEMNLFDPVAEDAMNSLEREVASLLDDQS